MAMMETVVLNVEISGGMVQHTNFNKKGELCCGCDWKEFDVYLLVDLPYYRIVTTSTSKRKEGKNCTSLLNYQIEPDKEKAIKKYNLEVAKFNK